MKEKEKNVPVLPWMRSPIDVTQFESCPLDLVPGLDPRLKAALQKNKNISSLYPVQVAVWQETIGPGGFERDLCINSQTGSGKTLAYALPIVQTLSTRAVKSLRALVVVPTRDLAIQVKEVFATIAPAVGLSVGLAVGQSSIATDISELINRPKLEGGICYDLENPMQELETSVDILVATPGRLMDHINNTRGFTLEHLCYLVVDETDRLLREAYQSWLPTVLKMTQSHNGSKSIELLASSFPLSSFGRLRTIRRCGVERGFKGKSYPRLTKMVLSATLTQDPSKLARLDLHHPLFLSAGRYQLPENLESYIMICELKMKPLYLFALLQNLEKEKCIVFTSSVESSHLLCTVLKFFGDLNVKIAEYSRLQRQSVKSKTLKAFRKGKIQVLVCSDAMTRGMDVEGVRDIINYDKPPNIKTHVHRAGRTARAGQAGRCFTLLHEDEVRQFRKMLRKAEIDSCPLYSVPSSSIESLRSTYESALDKLKARVESEKSKSRKRKVSNVEGLEEKRTEEIN